MSVARVQAQAKVNLGLKVYGRDASGYHEVATVFQRIDLADDVVVRVGGTTRSLDAAGPRMPAAGLGPLEKNLAFRAALAYIGHTGWPLEGFSIELTKNIPVGGGLGGGSADAAAVLRALDALAPEPLDRNARDALASSLGADVPFLASDWVTAVGLGRGDQLTRPQPAAPPADVVILVPPFAISTADAYRWLDEDREGAGVSLPAAPGSGDIEAPSDLRPWQALGILAGNDFEPVVERRHPELRSYRERLSSLGAEVARLSGSGSTVFGIFDRPAPNPRDIDIRTPIIATRTSSRVVQVEVLE